MSALDEFINILKDTLDEKGYSDLKFPLNYFKIDK